VWKADTVSTDLARADAATRRPGRPRSEAAEHAIIEATLDLFAADGVDGVCVEAVAARAGVGKATIYRRWPGKEELLIDAIGSLKTALPEPRGGSVREDLIAIAEVLVADAADPRYIRQYSMWMSEGHKYPKLMAMFKESVVEPNRRVIRGVLRRGVETGELRAGIDIDLSMFCLTGTVMARGKQGEDAFPPGFAEHLVDELMSGLAPR
jgi:AcrR family transcriptional regulator